MRCKWVTNYHHIHRNVVLKLGWSVVNGLQIAIVDTDKAWLLSKQSVVIGLQITTSYTGLVSGQQEEWIVIGLQIDWHPLYYKTLGMGYKLESETPPVCWARFAEMLWIGCKLRSFTPLHLVCTKARQLWIGYKLLPLTTIFCRCS